MDCILISHLCNILSNYEIQVTESVTNPILPSMCLSYAPAAICSAQKETTVGLSSLSLGSYKIPGKNAQSTLCYSILSSLIKNGTAFFGGGGAQSNKAECTSRCLAGANI